jgi:hypothetical protein
MNDRQLVEAGLISDPTRCNMLTNQFIDEAVRQFHTDQGLFGHPKQLNRDVMKFTGILQTRIKEYCARYDIVNLGESFRWYLVADEGSVYAVQCTHTPDFDFNKPKCPYEGHSIQGMAWSLGYWSTLAGYFHSWLKVSSQGHEAKAVLAKLQTDLNEALGLKGECQDILTRSKNLVRSQELLVKQNNDYVAQINLLQTSNEVINREFQFCRKQLEQSRKLHKATEQLLVITVVVIVVMGIGGVIARLAGVL